MSFYKFSVILIVFAVLHVVYSNNSENNNNLDEKTIEQGRTLVHNTVKRFMVILPAIFFKLGIAFTLLVLITLLAINNGFIGFLLLVVGLSSVLARLQDTSRRPTVLPTPYISHLPAAYHQHHTILDRADYISDNSKNNVGTTSYVDNYSDPNQKYNQLPLAYYKYATQG